MNVALIGCGAIASAYADGLAACPALALTCCADLDADNAAALANRYGLTPYTDAGALLAAEDVDLVINLTIHTAHAAVTRICLEAGCHVVSEKPLAMTADEAQSLVTLAEEQGCVLACAPISGWADAQQMAGRLVRDGHIGPVRTATATGNFGRTTEWHPAPQPFLEIGPLYDGAVYPLTVLTTLFGPVERVRTADAALLLDEHAHNGRSFRVDTPDHVTAVLEMADGPLVHLTASAYVPHRTRHFSSLELHGDAGSLYLDDCGNFDGDTDAPLLQVARLGRPYRPFPLPRPPHPLRYASLAVDAARAAERGAAPLASARQAAHVVATLTAVETSADAGGGKAVERCGFDRPEQPLHRPAVPFRVHTWIRRRRLRRDAAEANRKRRFLPCLPSGSDARGTAGARRTWTWGTRWPTLWRRAFACSTRPSYTERTPSWGRSSPTAAASRGSVCSSSGRCGTRTTGPIICGLPPKRL